jgi:uncharacterized protein (DUF58 family)
MVRLTIPAWLEGAASAVQQRLELPRRLEAARAQAEPFLVRVRPAWRTVTPMGRGALAVAVIAWFLGWRLGWVELFYAAALLVLVLLLAIPFVLGGSLLESLVEVAPDRVFVGDPAAGRLVVRNRSGRRILPVRVDLTVGRGFASFDLPSLAAGGEHDELIVVPTSRRAVIPVGPASSVVADPLGMLKREVSTSNTVELFVHPRVVPLPNLSSGLLRDLEGQTTKDLSTSDLAFHTLREYVPGDDRRYIHWRSSAKAGKLLVRQFLDTRRSRVTIVVDADLTSYRDEQEFELAISVAGSLGARCLQDELDLTVVGGGHATTPSNSQRLLDTLSRFESGDRHLGLFPAARRGSAMATDTSLAVLLTGSVISYADVRHAAQRFGPDVVPLVIRVETDAPSGLSRSGGMTVVAIRALSDLPRLLTTVMA